MNDENNTTNPFEEFTKNSDSLEENGSDYVDFGSSFENDNQNDKYYYDNNNEDETSYDNSEEIENTQEEKVDYNQDSYKKAESPQKSYDIRKKIPIILMIIVLLIVLVFLIKSLINTERPTENKENTTTEVTNDEEAIINKRHSVKSTVLANGNILLDINNKNSISVDANITIEFSDNAGDTINKEDINIKNIPAKSHYYESVYLRPELKGLEYELKTKLSTSKFKEYYNDKVEIVNTTEAGESLLIEIKNDSYFVIDVIEVYVIYYDSEDKIIGFETSSVKKLAVDKTAEVKIDYPKNTDYSFISFSKYDIGINTAYSYRSS